MQHQLQVRYLLQRALLRPALQADAGFPNWKDIAVENIEQIEVVKGAASALYGSSAMNGIINIRTGFAKSEPETKITTQSAFYMAPKDAQKKWWTKAPYEATASISHKQKFGKLDYVGTLFYYNFDSYNKNWYENSGVSQRQCDIVSRTD